MPMPQIAIPGQQALEAVQRRTQQMKDDRFKMAQLGMARKRMEIGESEFKQSKELKLTELENAKKRIAISQEQLDLSTKQSKRMDLAETTATEREQRAKTFRVVISNEASISNKDLSYINVGNILNMRTTRTGKIDKNGKFRPGLENADEFYKWINHRETKQLKIMTDLQAIIPTLPPEQQGPAIKKMNQYRKQLGYHAQSTYINQNSIVDMMTRQDFRQSIAAGVSMWNAVKNGMAFEEVRKASDIGENVTPKAYHGLLKLMAQKRSESESSKKPEEMLEEIAGLMEIYGELLKGDPKSKIFIKHKFATDSETGKTVRMGFDIVDATGIDKIPGGEAWQLIGEETHRAMELEKQDKQGKTQSHNRNVRNYNSEVKALSGLLASSQDSQNQISFQMGDIIRSIKEGKDDLTYVVTHKDIIEHSDKKIGEFIKQFTTYYTGIVESGVNKYSSRYTDAKGWLDLSPDEKKANILALSPVGRARLDLEALKHQYNYMKATYSKGQSGYLKGVTDLWEGNFQSIQALAARDFRLKDEQESLLGREEKTHFKLELK